MFKSLRDKLKKSLSVFSRKAEEEVGVSEEVVETPADTAKESEPTSETQEEPVSSPSPDPLVDLPGFGAIEEKKEEVAAEKHVDLPLTTGEKIEQKEVTPEELPKSDESVGAVSKEPAKEAISESEAVQQAPSEPSPSAQDILNEVITEEKPVVKEPEEAPQEPLPTTHVDKIIEAQQAQVEIKPTAEELVAEITAQSEVKEAVVEEMQQPVKEVITPEPEPQVEPKVDESQIEPEPVAHVDQSLATKERIEQKEPVQEESKGFLGRIKQALTTKTISTGKFEEMFWDLELALLESNVSLEVVEKIKNDLREELVDKPLPRNVMGKIEETLKRSVDEVVSVPSFNLLDKVKEKKPFVIAFFGINGSGKTTSSAKLAHLFLQNGLSVVFAASDTFRAAAIQQLQEHADKLGVKLISQEYGSDAAAVAFDAVKYAQNKGIDVVLIDTAGRLHSNTNLMGELEKLVRVSNPDLKIFVGESITGNDCIEQATKFNEAIGFDGIILTKADVDEKGGTPLSISYVTKKPILFIGTGQEYGDLKPFSKELVLENLGL